MKIKYYGNSCFYFKSKGAKLITNPFDKHVKVKLSSLEPDVVVLSHDADCKGDGYYIVSSAGEYEVKDLFVYGYVSDLSSDKKYNCDVYMFDIEGVHLGMIDKSVTKLRSWVINQMGIVNVLFVPLAEESGMKISNLSELVSKIEPEILVPMDYNEDKLREFAKVLGVKAWDKEKDLEVKSSDFTDEEASMKVIVLEN